MRKPPLHKSFRNALRGIFLMIRTERNFQIELSAMLANLFLVVFLGLSATDAALILGVCFAVLSAEIFNTAVEKICDFIQPEFDPLIGFIKDISAGAVTLLAFLALIIGALVYPKYLVAFFNHL